MIKLQKHPEPNILVQNSEIWTQVLLTKIAAGQVPTDAERTRYRHPQVKAALVVETSGKCAYCESKLLHIHHGDVEHIVPKSLDMEKIVEWSNLTLACEICNQNKSNLDPNASHILDPYNDEPEDHLKFMGSIVLSRGTAKGTSSSAILKLDRGELMERRLEKLQGLAKIAEVILREELPLPARRAMYADLLTNDASICSQFTAMARSFVDEIRRILPAEVTD